MASEYKKILLVKGLLDISDEHFSIVKSLLAHDLRLSRLQQETYDRIQIGSMMADKFRGAACVEKLIELIRDIRELKDLVSKLRKEKLKVARKIKAKEKKQQAANGPRTAAPRTSLTVNSGGEKQVPKAQKRKGTTKEKTGAKKNKVTPEQRRLAGPAQVSASCSVQVPASHPTQASDSCPAQSPASCPTQDLASCSAQVPAQAPALHLPQDPASNPSQAPGSHSSQALASLPAQIPASHHIQISATHSIQAPASRPLGLPQCSLNSPSAPNSSSVEFNTNQRTPGRQKTATKRSLLQKGPITVMVLKASKPFEYESPEKDRHTMFHATVVTPSQFFHVKVFNTGLKELFTKMKFLTISDYFECRGILEVHETSLVAEAYPDQKTEIPRRIMNRARETPKIINLLKLASGTYVYGLFELHKKQVNKKKTIYEIQDKTGKMDVVGNGKWYNLRCDEGDKLRLYCFQLRRMAQKLILACGTHSFIQVTKTRKNKKGPQSGPPPPLQVSQ